MANYIMGRKGINQHMPRMLWQERHLLVHGGCFWRGHGGVWETGQETTHGVDLLSGNLRVNDLHIHHDTAWT